MVKKFVIIFLLLFLNQCGYDSIYSKKSINFNITSFSLEDDLKIGRLIERRLKAFSDDSTDRKNFEITISSFKEKNISSKDKEGNPKTFDLILKVVLTAIDTSNQKYKRMFTENLIVNNRDNKFDQKKYEDTSYENLAGKIVDDIILQLQNISGNKKQITSITGNIGLTTKTNDN